MRLKDKKLRKKLRELAVADACSMHACIKILLDYTIFIV